MIKHICTRQEALDSAQSFIQSHFGTANTTRRPHCEIPASNNDDDIRLITYIQNSYAAKDFVDPKIIEVLDLVLAEYTRAAGKHPRFPTCHHGHSVILEEVDELWDEIKADKGNMVNAKKEAIQVAVTAIRYVLDLCQ